MSTKDFKEGMIAGAKPFGDKLDQLANVSEKAVNDIKEGLDGVTNVVNVVLDDLSAQEKKRIYDLDVATNADTLDNEEKEFLVAVLTELANAFHGISELQKRYILSICNTVGISAPQASVDISCIENINNMQAQKIILRHIMEFFFIGTQNYDFLEDYENEIFCYFSVNKRGISEIKSSIDRIYNAMGVEGVALRYSFLTGISVDNTNVPDVKEDNMLTKAEKAYLDYDIKNAFSLFTYLASQGNGRACYFLGEIYLSNFDNVAEKNKDEAQKWFSVGAERGDILSKLNCAFSTDDDMARKAVFNETFLSVLSLAQQGDVFAMNEVAGMFDYGYGTKKDEGKAIYWLEKSAAAGYWLSMDILGSKSNKSEQYDKAVKHFSKAAELGYEGSIYNLGRAYCDGNGVDKNGTKAFELFETAAKKGHHFAQLWTGIAYDFKAKEFGITRNLEKAEKWYRLAVAGNSASACWNLAILISNKSHDLRNNEEELYYLTKASMLGMEEATLEMAVRLCSGDGVTEKMKEEFGEMKVSDSDSFVGMLWDAFTTKDEREEKIKEQGKRILEKYAEQGNGVAQYYLGVLYTDNMYLGNNKELARKWLKKAKENGISNADYAYSVVSKSFWFLGPPLIYYAHKE